MTTTKTSAKGTGAKTNKKKGSLVKTVVIDDKGKWVKPNTGEKFYISEDAVFPEIDFEIDTQDTGPYIWEWNISWVAAASGLRESKKRGKVLRTFSTNGRVESNEKTWRVSLPQTVGGTLTVKVSTSNEKFKRSIYILGKNPNKDQVTAFLSTLDGVLGFDKLLEQESRFKNFIESDGYPVVSFDSGYGMTQLTNPPPSYVQVWNWKENIRGGTGLYKVKQAEAKKYLSSNGRQYTAEQLKLETWSRWNGSPYHIWSSSTNSWTRNPNVLSDTSSSNIGWDITKAENVGKTEKELHDRDKEQYRDPPPKAERLWMYSGVVYADHVNH